jgi:membrane protein
MSWLWISVTLVIVGTELSSEMEHQTARDSTTGPAKPIGARGAHMADTVGRVWPPAREKVETTIVEQPRRRVSLGALAFATPAALALHWRFRGRPRC